MGPPPATPQPLPYTGAEPGARHGIVRLKSSGPEDTLVFIVRAKLGSDGSPGIVAGCENHMHSMLLQSPASSVEPLRRVKT
jgi:hypothetical protein